MTPVSAGESARVRTQGFRADAAIRRDVSHYEFRLQEFRSDLCDPGKSETREGRRLDWNGPYVGTLRQNKPRNEGK